MIIKVAEIWSRNITETKRVKLNVMKTDSGYYYLTNEGAKSVFYRNLNEAKNDIEELWGSWIDFKLLI